MSDFPWMASHSRTRAGATAATHDDEVRRRATLLAHLGYSQAAAQKRLQANFVWEHERLGKPAVLARLPALVSEAYQRAGATPERTESTPRKKRSTSTPRQTKR